MQKLRPFLSGMLAMAMIVSLTGTAFAAAAVSFNQIGIRLFGESKVTAGESFKAANGQEVPSVITYTDAAGKYVVFQVTNNGTTAQAVTVDRVRPVSVHRTEPFTTVTLAPGQTVTRAFSIASDSTQLERTLEFGVDPIDRPNGIDITVSLMQYK